MEISIYWFDTVRKDLRVKTNLSRSELKSKIKGYITNPEQMVEDLDLTVIERAEKIVDYTNYYLERETNGKEIK